MTCAQGMRRVWLWQFVSALLSPVFMPRVSTKAASLADGPTLASTRDYWILHLRSEGKAERTISPYLRALDRLDAFLVERGMPRALGAIRREHLEAFGGAWISPIRRAPTSSGLGRARLNQEDDDRIASRADGVPVKTVVNEDFSISSDDCTLGVTHLRIRGSARRLKPGRPVHLISPSVVGDGSDLVPRLEVDDEMHREGQCCGWAQIGICWSQLQDRGLLGSTANEAQEDRCKNESHRQHFACQLVNGRRRIATRIKTADHTLARTQAQSTPPLGDGMRRSRCLDKHAHRIIDVGGLAVAESKS